MTPTRHDRTRTTLDLLIRSLRRVLETTGAADVAEHLPWTDAAERGPTMPSPAPHPAPYPAAIADTCVQATSVAFHLLDAAEENAEAQHRRDVEASGALADDAGSWDQMLGRALARGATPADIAAALARVRVEPVFTAHPTEARRQTVLEHHRQLYRLLVELENTMWTDAERAALEGRIESGLERLWRTGEIHLEKPSLADERRGIVHYLRHVFPDVLPRFDEQLRAAWSRAGLDAALLDAHRGPTITFGDWVGGDRDGHPGVTADVTAETLGVLRANALDLLDERLARLAVGLSLSAHRQPTPPALAGRVRALAEALGDEGARALARNAGEPWRQLVNLMRAALPLEHRSTQGRYTRAADLRADLETLRAGLVDVGADRLARADVDPMIRLVDTFGFHLARLDVRQNSAFHDRAIGWLLAHAGVDDGASYPDWPLARRRQMLDAELATQRPFAALADIDGDEARAVVTAYRVLAAHHAQHGPDGLGALIVSMTRSVEDLLAVFLLAREGRVRVNDGGTWVCPLEVVPLFETIDDLERAPDILDDYLSHPLVKASLAYQQRVQGLPEPVQQVMVGYSDSGKDGGITCSFWSLYRGQSRLAEVGRTHGVRVRFFHGRGGTIGRGAGPTHRFVKALPVRSVGGDLRITEQGETIAQKYANRITAAHHLELLAAGTLYATVSDDAGREDPPELLALMDTLSRTSRAAYRDLLETDGFVRFFGLATPLDAIEASRIGSRPARRTGQRSLADLRAIPWVFAWNQSRFILPGWYGLGSALIDLRDRDPGAFDALVAAKGEDRRWDPLHYLVSNAATAWMTSAPDVMRSYAALVDDAALRARVMDRVEREHARTGQALEAIYGGTLADVRPDVHDALVMRDEALRPLHAHQIRVLRRWRDLRDGGHASAADEVLPELLLTVNAIASGLGATG